MAIIHIAHDMRDIAGADRIVVMDQGGILIEGTPAEVFGQSDRLRSIGLDCPTEGVMPSCATPSSRGHHD